MQIKCKHSREPRHFPVSLPREFGAHLLYGPLAALLKDAAFPVGSPYVVACESSRGNITFGRFKSAIGTIVINAEAESPGQEEMLCALTFAENLP